MTSALCAILIAAAAAAPAFGAAQTPPVAVKAYVARPVNPHPPTIDGRLDDPVWAKAPWEGGFAQRVPLEGAVPSEATAFKILYDAGNVYVAIRAEDAKGSVERRMSRRDETQGDRVDVTFDSYFDRYTGFLFGVNAAGVKYDQLVTNDSMFQDGQDMSWDPIWDVATASDAAGWTAEMRIPLSQLRFSGQADQTWGLQVTRRLFRNDEWSLWQPIPRNSPGWVHLFGELRGLQGLRPRHQVEVMPYTVAKARTFREVPGNPFAKGSAASLAGGLDAKIGVTNDLTLNLTVNPDFGQVEADPSVVNLTAYETYYEEKRPFFVEGRNILDFDLMGGNGDFSQDNLFYSRRIGRAPQLRPEPEDGFVRMPEAAAILGAFKLTGKTRRGLSIGVLESVTGRATASVFAGGRTAREPVEPLTDYFAARVQQDFNKGRTVLGGMMTATLRNTSNPGLRFLHDAAYAGGFNFQHQWRNRTYYLGVKGVASRVEGTPEAIARTQRAPQRYFQSPDAAGRFDPARTSLSGHGGTVDFGKQGGGRFLFSLGTTWRSPGLELNDMGYLRQADAIMSWGWAGYRFFKPFAVFRNAGINVNAWTGWNFAGTRLFRGGNVNCNAQLKSFWFVGFGVNRNEPALQASALRGGPMLRVPGLYSSWVWLETDSRKKVRAEVQAQGTARENGEMRQLFLQGGLVLVPSEALNVRLLPNLVLNRNEMQYVATVDAAGPRYVFGRIDQKTLGLTVRLDYSLTPDLSIQFYGQPFVSAGRYDRLKAIVDPRSRDWAARYHEFGAGEISYDAAARTYAVAEAGRPAWTLADPDFRFLQFRSNLVVRWEYRPGSTLFLVWSQGRTGVLPTGEFELGRGLQDLFDVHPENVFLLKASYNFDL